jgi:hypothetical protein
MMIRDIVRVTRLSLQNAGFEVHAFTDPEGSVAIEVRDMGRSKIQLMNKLWA